MRSDVAVRLCSVTASVAHMGHNLYPALCPTTPSLSVYV